MSKSLSKYNFTGEFRSVQKSIKILGRTVKNLIKLIEISGASSKSTPEIDTEVIKAFGSNPPEELNGVLISDPLNNYLLLRQNGSWKKVKVE